MDNIPVRFQFAGIHILSKNVLELKQPILNTAVFSFNIRVETQVQAENRLVISMVSVIISEQNLSLDLANFKIACVFQIENFVEVIKLDEQGVYIVPPSFEATTRPVSISTVRGIIYSELRGTYLNNAIMPVVTMDAFVEEPKKVHPQDLGVKQ